MGSGALTRPHQAIRAGATVVGSRRGCCVELAGHDPAAETAPTVAPFGRAFYLKLAPYRVRVLPEALQTLHPPHRVCFGCVEVIGLLRLTTAKATAATAAVLAALLDRCK